MCATRKWHNSLENHGRNEHHTFFIVTSTKAFWSSCLEREHHWSSHGAVAVTTASTKLHPQGFNNSQSNALHMTLLHPPTPPPPHLYTIKTFIVHDKTDGPWKLRGTPSLDPIYIYIYISLCGGFDGWLHNSSWPFHYKLDMLWGMKLPFTPDYFRSTYFSVYTYWHQCNEGFCANFRNTSVLETRVPLQTGIWFVPPRTRVLTCLKLFWFP